MHRRRYIDFLRLALLALAFAPAYAVAAASSAEDATTFENKVRPLLAENCFKCHGAKKQESGLRLDSLATMIRGGDRGPAIVPGAPEKSLLINAVARHGDVQMPPDSKLNANDVALLATWIQHGAPWPNDSGPSNSASAGSHVVTRSGGPSADERRFWSFQPIVSPEIPKVRTAAWCKTPIDAFVLARQETAGVVAVKPADKRTLLRRATFDLTGLPSSPADVADFLADNSPNAFARVVDRLLASPAYGERWGRHWLDVVRYADTAGETADYPVREAYKYRNYVINAFNQDKPYDEFLREQIAGDILAANGPREKYAERVTATGFIAISRRFGFDPENYQHLTIQDTIDTLGQAALGLTIGCARCHDHKFDPISTRDYYALYGIFASTNYSFAGSEEKKRPSDMVPLVAPAEAAAAKKAFDAQLAKLADDAKRNDADQTDANRELKAAAAKSAAATDASAKLNARLAELRVQRADIERRRSALVEAGPSEMAYGVVEGTDKNARIQMRGEPTKLGDEAPRRFLEILGGDPLPAKNSGSGRLELAAWLTRPQNPLTPRVMVNRIWQHHFGHGIVQSENDFDARGMRPTHPELLDYLANRFIASGWSIKAMHRLIMLSQTYQLAADDEPHNAEVDPPDDLLWRFNRSRLDAESFRDTLLWLGGNLDQTMGGPHPFPPVESWNFTQHDPFTAEYDTNRRSVYLMTMRLRRHPYLDLFDGADPNATTARRQPTIVPTQALFLMNSPFVYTQSNGLAARLIRERPDDASRIEWGYQLVLARPPSEQDRKEALEFVSQYREQLAKSGVAEDQRVPLSLAAFARTLMISNEFLYVE